jgi:hypothetical protein
VTHDVEPYTIVAGNPARPIRSRFDSETIILLEESRWWELAPDQVMRFYKLIDRPAEFGRAIIEWRKNGAV